MTKAFPALLSSLLWLLLLTTKASAYHKCGFPDPSEREILETQRFEMEMFGNTVQRMNRRDFSDIIQKINERRASFRNRVKLFFGRIAGRLGFERIADAFNPPSEMKPYRLVDVPIVFHVLPNMEPLISQRGVNVARGEQKPSLTDAQKEFAVNITNKFFNIYDRESKTETQFISFVTEDIILHEDIVIRREIVQLFLSLERRWIDDIVTKADEFEFKIHVIIGEDPQVAGLATPWEFFAEDTPKNSVVYLDHRALACYDEEGNYLCDDPDGKSKTRWSTNRSGVLAHELGHIFGLLHTFQGECDNDGDVNDGDAVSDTPAHAAIRQNGCPGLIPYDRDRDLFDESLARKSNEGNEETCGGAENVCGTTCAACCTKYPREDDPPEGYPFSAFTEPEFNPYCVNNKPDNFFLKSYAVVTEDERPDYPNCCNPEYPIDSCPDIPGIDPVLNVMSYSPDWCYQEFTAGQMARMMAVTRRTKSFLYCNYADVLDEERCSDVPCGSTATSPNCV